MRRMLLGALVWALAILASWAVVFGVMVGNGWLQWEARSRPPHPFSTTTFGLDLVRSISSAALPFVVVGLIFLLVTRLRSLWAGVLFAAPWTIWVAYLILNDFRMGGYAAQIDARLELEITMELWTAVIVGLIAAAAWRRHTTPRAIAAQ